MTVCFGNPFVVSVVCVEIHEKNLRIVSAGTFCILITWTVWPKIVVAVF